MTTTITKDEAKAIALLRALLLADDNSETLGDFGRDALVITNEARKVLTRIDADANA